MNQKESLELAEETAKSLGVLFDIIGSQKNQDTPVYRSFLLAKSIILENPKNFSLIKIQLEALFGEVSNKVWQYLLTSQDIGLVHLDSTIALYGFPTPLNPALDSNIHDSIMGILRQQLNAIFAALQTGEVDIELLVGGDSFWGVLSPLPVTKETKNWSATVAGLMLSLGLEDFILEENQWVYQAVAIVDRDTTKTCLLVHGQTQPVGVPFELSGVPRYGDHILKPPFHDWCRTSRALVETSDAASILTAQMTDEAGDEVIRREDNKKK